MKLNGHPAWCAYAGVILGLHVLGLAALLHTARSHATLLGMGFLAYTLGLRHAFDADHIAAIDNAVRKLVRQRQSPLGTGFYFSLGHSTVVFVLALAIAVSRVAVGAHYPSDVIAGAFVGGGYAYWLADRLASKRFIFRRDRAGRLRPRVAAIKRAFTRPGGAGAMLAAMGVAISVSRR